MLKIYTSNCVEHGLDYDLLFGCVCLIYCPARHSLTLVACRWLFSGWWSMRPKAKKSIPTQGCLPYGLNTCNSMSLHITFASIFVWQVCSHVWHACCQIAFVILHHLCRNAITIPFMIDLNDVWQFTVWLMHKYIRSLDTRVHALLVEKASRPVLAR